MNARALFGGDDAQMFERDLRREMLIKRPKRNAADDDHADNASGKQGGAPPLGTRRVRLKIAASRKQAARRENQRGRIIPRIDERRAAQRRAGHQERRPIEALAAFRHLRQQADEQQQKRNRHEMRMQIAQQKAEIGEFVNRVGNHAGTAPPIERKHRAAALNKLKQAVHVRGEREQKRGEQAERDAPRPMRDQAETSGRRHAENRGEREIEADGRNHAGRLDHGRPNHVAEIVIIHERAGKPGVLRREIVAAQNGVQQGEIGLFFRAGQVGIIHADSDAERKHSGKKEFADEKQAQHRFRGRAEFREMPEKNGEIQDAQHHERGGNRARLKGRDTQASG